VPAILEEGAVPGTYRIIGKSDYRPGEAGGCTALAAAKGQTLVMELPRLTHLLHEVHRWICRHHQAADPTHWREAYLHVVPEADAAFRSLNEALCAAPVLWYPRPGEKFIVDRDANNVGIGGLLSQVEEGLEWVVVCLSKALYRAASSDVNYWVSWREQNTSTCTSTAKSSTCIRTIIRLGPPWLGYWVSRTCKEWQPAGFSVSKSASHPNIVRGASTPTPMLSLGDHVQKNAQAARRPCDRQTDCECES
jgi:hypothetical protein